MNGYIISGIIILVLGTGVGTYLIQKGRTKLAFENTTTLVEHFKTLDNQTKTEILEQSDLNKDEIIVLVNNQTKSSAVKIISEVKDKFGLIQDDLFQKGEQLNELQQLEIRKSEENERLEKLKRTAPDVDTDLYIFKENELILNINFNNQVPILFDYSVTDENNVVLGGIIMSKEELHPRPNNDPFNYRHGKISTFRISKKTPTKFVLNFRYSSIYQKELSSLSLSKTQKKIYIFDPIKKQLFKMPN